MRDREERIKKEKMELEKMMAYNPFGKAGCGAPYKDLSGNAIADRRAFS